MVGGSHVVKHTLFAALLVLYVVVMGQNWTFYTAAIMAAVYVRHHGRLLEPL